MRFMVLINQSHYAKLFRLIKVFFVYSPLHALNRKVLSANPTKSGISHIFKETPHDNAKKRFSLSEF